MAIYDCFQYFNEEHMLDLRLNILDKYVDFFVISESTKTHQGESKKLNFNIKKFKKYENKIKYIVADFDKEEKKFNHTGGESQVEKHQRNAIHDCLQDAHDNDLIIISDSDEIPDLTKLNQIKKSTKFTAFSQIIFMYKLNLQNKNESNWIGSKVCLKKYFPGPQKFRDLKFKNYPIWRFDKYNQQIIKGGWHFSFLHTPQDIAKKIRSYSHGEFNTKDNTNEEKIEQKIINNKDIFDRGFKLEKIQIDSSFPEYIVENQTDLKDWIA